MLRFACLGLSDKCVATLFAIILECGLSVRAIRAYLHSVRAVVSDFGTEAGLADCKDVLPQMLRVLTKGRLKCDEEQFAFPRAIQMPGWRSEKDAGRPQTRRC